MCDFAVFMDNSLQESTIGISKLWGSVWRPEYFTSLRLYKHICWEDAETSDRGSNFRCIFLDFLDLYIDTFDQVYLYPIERR